MVTWHLSMKLFPTKCHERATLQKLWRQSENSSLFPVNSSLLTAVARDGWNLSAVFKFCFCFVLLYNKSLHDCSPWDQSLSVYCLIPLELIQLQWLRIKNKALTFLMFIPVICMGYPIYLGIAVWLRLKEFNTLYHICKYLAYK